jgi:uncharacterized protein with ParB-like and HNH nuclease domain
MKMTTVGTESTIRSDQRSIGSILSDKPFLRVPPYQRSFSWAKIEIQELRNDLQSVVYDEGNDNYFLGSMVFIRKQDNSLEVVDGQQRLATMSLFLTVIRDGFKTIKDIERADHVELKYLCARALKTMEASPRLSLNEADNDLFSKIIDNSVSLETIEKITKDKDTFESNRLLANAYVTIWNLIKNASSNFSNTEYLSNLVEVLSEYVSCIQITTTSEDAAYILFETLNDRGVDLTLSDMLKNFLFSKAGKRIEEIKHRWTEIVTLIGQEFMKTFIRHEWMSKYGQTREKELYSKIKSEIKSNPKAIDYATNLKEAAIVYDAIGNSDHEIWSSYGVKCQRLIEEINLLGPTQCFPLILSTYFTKPKDIEIILRWIVSLTVRYSIIGSKGTGNLETTYARASSLMRKQDSKLKDVKDILLAIWPSDEEFKVAFSEKTLTSPRIIKYIFAKMECYQSSNDSLIPNPENLSVEHILPKKPSKEWSLDLRKEDFLRENVKLIGNLTILTEPMNRECESKKFSDKKDIYKKSKYNLTKTLSS